MKQAIIMKPIQSQIRDALVLRLQMMLPAPHIFDALVFPLTEDQLPALTIQLEHDRILEEWSALLRPGVSIHTHECVVSLRIFVKSHEKISEVLDALVFEVIQILERDPTLGGLCQTLQIEIPEMTTIHEGESPIARMTLTCKIYYRQPSPLFLTEGENT